MTPREIGPSYWADRTGFDQVIEDRDALAAEIERLTTENAEQRALIAALSAALEDA